MINNNKIWINLTINCPKDATFKKNQREGYWIKIIRCHMIEVLKIPTVWKDTSNLKLSHLLQNLLHLR